MRYILSILLISISSYVNAEDYYWWASGIPAQSTPQAACALVKDRVTSERNPALYAYDSMSVYMLNVGQYRCAVLFAKKWEPGYEVSNVDVFRGGNACPGESVYNSSTGLCDAPVNPCADKSGQMVTSDENMGTEFPLIFGKLTVSACVQGCTVPLATSTECVTKAKTFETICRFKGFYDGTQCEASASDGFIGEPIASLPSDPTPEVTEEKQPCVYVTDAEGRKHCTSSDASYSDGSQKCGTVNTGGVEHTQCYPATPASSSKTDIDTTVETKSNADGSSTTTKTDTATKTDCSGPNSCSTTTTTTKTTITKGADGTTSSSTTTCTGSNCSDAGESSNGGDTGNCPPGETCEQGENFSGDELDEVPGFGESLNTFMDAVESAPLVTSITSLHVAQGGSCNFPEAQTAIGTISMDSFCDLASVLDNLSAVFLAMWGLAAIRVLMSA